MERTNRPRVAVPITPHGARARTVVPVVSDAGRLDPATPPILIVIDDDAGIRELVADVAGESGYRVVSISDPRALDRASVQEAHVVVLDLMMPAMDGVEVVRSLAAQHARADLVIMSGLDDRILAGASATAEDLGLRIRGVLHKPFPIAELQALLAFASSTPVIADRQPVPDPHDDATVEEIAVAIGSPGQLVVHYQPQVTTADGRWVSSEALVRWHHPRHGLVAPAVFLPLVADAALGLPLTYRVLELAIADRQEMVAATGVAATVAVNLHGSVLESAAFPDRALEIVERMGAHAADVTLEVTEETVDGESGEALANLTRLRVLGFRLSIDDFGKGHSSLHRLHRVPFNELKIDKSFVQAAAHDTTARTIVESSVTLAVDLGLRIVVEGVETVATWEWLARLGADLMQGYFIARPLPPSSMRGWMTEWNVMRRSLPRVSVA